MSVDQLTNRRIVKYSHAVNDNTEEKIISWTHITEQDMFLVIDNALFSSSSNSQVYPGKSLRVVDGSNNVMEHMPLEYMCKTAKSAALEAQNQGRSLTQTQRSIYAIGKSPCIALRYRRFDGKARRIQVRFSMDAHYREVLQILLFFECPITNHETSPQTTTSGPSCPPTALNELPGRSIKSAGLSYAGPPPFYHDSRETLRFRPTTSTAAVPTSLFPHQMDIHNQQSLKVQPHSVTSLQPLLNTLPATVDNHTFARPHTSTSVFPIYPAYQLLQQSEMLQTTPHNIDDYNIQTTHQNFHQANHHTDPRTTAPITPRPATAPVTQMPMSISSILPPRRELPFETKRPSSKRSTASGISSRPRSAHPTVAGKSEQDAPRPASPYNAALDFPVRTTTSSRPSTSSCLPGSHTEQTQITAPIPSSRPSTSGHPRSYADQQKHQFQRLDIRHNAPGPIIPAPSSPPLKRLYPTPQPRLPKLMNSTMHIAPTIEENLSADTLSHANLVGYASTATTTLTKLVDETTSAAMGSSGIDISGGGGGDSNDAKRRRTMTDLICRYLKDDNFLKLAEEVEGEWRRVIGGF